MLTLFQPATGQVRVKGVTSTTNLGLHGWLKQALTTLLDSLPQPAVEFDPEANRAFWASWGQGLSHPADLPADVPPLRMLLVLDNLAGHKSELGRLRERYATRGAASSAASCTAHYECPTARHAWRGRSDQSVLRLRLYRGGKHKQYRRWLGVYARG
jgi:hypothetical protein